MAAITASFSSEAVVPRTLAVRLPKLAERNLVVKVLDLVPVRWTCNVTSIGH